MSWLLASADYLAVLLRLVLSAGILLTVMPLTIYLERKGSALIQDRPGPNRAALFGMFRLGGVAHVLADVIKLITKEDIIPAGVNRFYFKLAPFIVAFIPLTTFMIVPIADDVRLSDTFATPMATLELDGGLLWFFAMTSLAVYGVVFAGWASNNKFSLLGGIRSSAQLLSYEIPMALSVIAVMLTYATVQPNAMVQAQGELLWGFLPHWGIILQPLGFIVFITCAFAEINRVPFDLAEGEAELVAGYHTEYSGMRFGLFFMAEYMALVTSGALTVTMFLGGWQLPGLPTERLIADAGILIPAFVAGAGLLLAFGAGRLVRHYRDYTRGRWGDRRDLEPLVFGVLFAVGAVLHFAGAGAAWAARDLLPSWMPPIFAAVVQVSVFTLKLLFLCWCFVWVRWTMPRFRYDQVMDLGWKNLLPLALFNLLVTAVLMLKPWGRELLPVAPLATLLLMWVWKRFLIPAQARIPATSRLVVQEEASV
ncbi:MAG: complex I subunit 1 family protein [Candidatus Sericytochromatia bacterium]|nr:complex I subunit 1 family protein [Candidatus Sericytochromatia bacterium]